MSRFGNKGLAATPGVKLPRQQMSAQQQLAQMHEQARLRAQMLSNNAQQAVLQAQRAAQNVSQLEAIDPSATPQAIAPGALVQYYSDLASGRLPPEDMRIEALQYRVQIAPDGSVTSESESVMLVSRYNFAIRRVMGFVMDPINAGAAPTLVDFNIQEDGRNFTVFKTDVSMAAVVSNGGAGNVAEWDGVYITIPGTQLSITWSVDTSRWAALVGATKEFGVQIIGDLVVCQGDG